MKDIKLIFPDKRDRDRNSIETFIMTLSATNDKGETVSTDIDINGNNIRSAAWGASLVVQALHELEEK